MKKAVFCVVPPCTDVSEDRIVSIFTLADPSASTCSRWFLARRIFYPEDEVDTIIRNVGSHKNYTEQQSRKQLSSITEQEEKGNHYIEQHYLISRGDGRSQFSTIN
jgi:hypothetical protein